MPRKGDIRTGSATTTATLLLGERLNRRAIVLIAPLTGSYTVSDSPTITNGQGVLVVAGGVPVVLDSAVVGDLTQRSLYVIGSASLNFGFIEVTE